MSMADARPTRSLSSTATLNALSTVGVRLSSLIVGMILTPFVLHRIGPELYGVMVAAGSAYDYLSLLRGGIGGALRRYVTLHHHAGRHEEANRYYAAGFWWAMMLRLGILLVALALAGPLSRFLNIPPALYRDCIAGVSLIFVAAVISDTSATLEVPIYATGRTATLTAFWGLFTWVRLLFTVLGFRLIANSLAVYGGATVATEVVSLLALIVLVQRAHVVRSPFPPPQLGEPAVRRDVFQYGGLMLLFQISAVLYLSTDQLLIGRFFGPVAVTHYSMGARWFPLVFSFIVAAINSLTPLFTSMDARGEMERSREGLRRVTEVATILAVPACLAPCVVGDLFLSAWVGPEYRDSAKYLIAMLAPLVLEAAVAPVFMALHARGRIGLIAAVHVPVAIGNVAISLLLGLTLGMGPLGFALGNTLALVAKNLALLAYLSRKPDPAIPPAGQVLRPLFRAVLGGLPGLVVLYLARPLLGGGLTVVIAGGAVGGALSLVGAALATLGPTGVRGLVAQLLRMTGRRSAPPSPPAA